MTYQIDETHDPNLRSWVESANDPASDFPIQNLPFCVVQYSEDVEIICTRIGDRLLNLGSPDVMQMLGNIEAEMEDALTWTQLDYLAMAPIEERVSLRRSLQRILAHGADPFENKPTDEEPIWLQVGEHEWSLPCLTDDYTDFYASIHHATNVGSMFRPNNALLPNYKFVPIGYHGRASSLVPSGTPIRRPFGQQAPAEEGGVPTFGPCKMLDYELEVGFFVGQGNELGEPIDIAHAEESILGICLVNDWSARDIQKWEYQPLGPFLSKSFGTTVSPYVVTMEALAPFRAPAFNRPASDPKPLPHLFSEEDQSNGAIDLTVEAYLQSAQMRERGMEPVRLSRGSLKDMYWTISQMLTHHTSNGCNVTAGDLMASGTVSGPSRDARGCLLELTWDGDPWANPPKVVPGTERTPITLPTGEERRFLADGDEVTLKGFCEREGRRRIGLGECVGAIVPAEGG